MEFKLQKQDLDTSMIWPWLVQAPGWIVFQVARGKYLGSGLWQQDLRINEQRSAFKLMNRLMEG